ncbi:MAG: carboxypeptidase-like regulatory domain-containing protein [Nannocystaceae bacterium]|nr:carboxypeptidase-like regulatory domain-containing protein [Nannocystaceae bacterium]
MNARPVVATALALVLVAPTVARGANAPVIVEPTDAAAPTAEAPTAEAPTAEAPTAEAPPVDAPDTRDAPGTSDAPSTNDATSTNDASTEVTTAPTGDALLGRIEGRITASEAAGVGVPGARVRITCTCLPEPVELHSEFDGRFGLGELPPGVYVVAVDREGPSSERTISVEPGGRAELELAVAPASPVFDLEHHERKIERAGLMIAAGSVAALGGLLMIVAAGVEANKPECMFGLDDCANAPRPEFARALGIAGGVVLAGGAALVGVGIARRHRLRAQLRGDWTSIGVTVSGRF